MVRHDGAGLIVAPPGPVRAMFGRPVTPPPVVGDWVVLDLHRTPQATLPRYSLLRRRAAGGEGEQALVANVDVVLMVCGLDRPVRIGRIQRTITLANDAGAEPLVVLTKADKVDPAVAAEAEVIVAEADPTLEVVTLSAQGGWGIDDLLTRIGPRTVALIGESGAGKSTLVNAMVAATWRPRAWCGRRCQGPSHHHLGSCTCWRVAASWSTPPGSARSGIFADAEAVAETFPEIDELTEHCRFRDCAHRGRARAARCRPRSPTGRSMPDVSRTGGTWRPRPPRPPCGPTRWRGAATASSAGWHGGHRAEAQASADPPAGRLDAA